jgi:hypothetical protein
VGTEPEKRKRSMIDPQAAQASHPIIANWVKTLITALIGAAIGFGSAIASEVWKSNRTEKRRAVRIEHAIYSEMADLYERIHYLTTNDEWTDQQYEISASLLKQIRTEAHQFAKSNPDVFYTLPKALQIDEIYRGLPRYRSTWRGG